MSSKHSATKGTWLRVLSWAPIYLVCLSIAGCVTYTPVDRTGGRLMPQEVALQIFDRNGVGAWARKPKVMNICGGKWIDVTYFELSEANFITSKSRLDLSQKQKFPAFCVPPSVSFKVTSEANAREIVDAAIAMGATIDTMKVSP